MLRYEGSIDIIINLRNGVYYFEEVSSTGKSRLAKLLKVYSRKGLPVISYSYDDKVLGIPFSILVKPGKQELLLLDRYDLYNGEFKEEIEEFAKTGVVLIDIKGPSKVACEECIIKMEKTLIEVAEDE